MGSFPPQGCGSGASAASQQIQLTVSTAPISSFSSTQLTPSQPTNSVTHT